MPRAPTTSRTPITGLGFAGQRPSVGGMGRRRGALLTLQYYNSLFLRPSPPSPPPPSLQAAGSTQNGRDSQPKYLGFKMFGGEVSGEGG